MRQRLQPKSEGLLPTSILDPESNIATLALVGGERLDPATFAAGGFVAGGFGDAMTGSDASPAFELWFDADPMAEEFESEPPMLASEAAGPGSVVAVEQAGGPLVVDAATAAPVIQPVAVVATPGVIEGGSLRRQRGQ